MTPDEWTDAQTKRVRESLLTAWRNRRGELGLTRYEVASRLGYRNASSLYHLESERHRGIPRVETIVRVCAALDLDPWVLLKEATNA